jgi:hypothetical protein
MLGLPIIEGYRAESRLVAAPDADHTVSVIVYFALESRPEEPVMAKRKPRKGKPGY